MRKESLDPYSMRSHNIYIYIYLPILWSESEPEIQGAWTAAGGCNSTTLLLFISFWKSQILLLFKVINSLKKDKS